MSSQTTLSALCLCWLVLSTCANAAEPETTTIRRNGFEITLPTTFEENAAPPAGILLLTTFTGQVDQRQLDWGLGVNVRFIGARTIAGTNFPEKAQTIANNLRANMRQDLIDDPTIEPAKLENSSGACIMQYRFRRSGKQHRALDLFAQSGDQIYLLDCSISAFPGSEVLAANGSQAKLLRSIIQSFKLIPGGATQPATSKPSS